MRRLSYRKVQIKIAGSGKNLNLLDLLCDFHCWHATVHGFFSKPQACCFSTQWHADMKWNLKTISSPKLLWWLLAVGLELIRLSHRIQSSKNSRNSNGFFKLFKRRTCFSCCINMTWTIFHKFCALPEGSAACPNWSLYLEGEMTLTVDDRCILYCCKVLDLWNVVFEEYSVIQFKASTKRSSNASDISGCTSLH